MSTFESYRSINKGCIPANAKLQASPTHPGQALRMRQLGSKGKLFDGGQPMGRPDKLGQLAMSKSLSSFANDPVKSDSLIALGALAAFGAASYGLLRSHWERNSMVQDLNERERKEYLLKQRARVKQEREELQRFENAQVFKIVVTGVLLALAALVLLYKGWFFLLLALLLAFSVLVCTFA
ncbi:hypothetical protein PHYSODRAFT_343113 [Phytophthora sojae]|uniref:Transmembrane protein n=1 Tax=Phytophthora sojae (strain P6497) TaxID=1094619 RepID=G5AIN2_PHYSP|nr:hypothetical protein PHYSODRAFT_343113 [Phytophthora sojae]EGZ04642.1 hypothetical protein PHYSODRAFT_343113 [Phytophthora sojae]|eukprot:XP_009539933.1 hypothetical protein PHYSODRAFT_343113 [Phytophthora sojae]